MDQRRLPRMGVMGYNVKELSDGGIASVPTKFVQTSSAQEAFIPHNRTHEGAIPVIDLSGLQGDQPRRDATLAAIASACEEWGFFQVIIPIHKSCL